MLCESCGINVYKHRVKHYPFIKNYIMNMCQWCHKTFSRSDSLLRHQMSRCTISAAPGQMKNNLNSVRVGLNADEFLSVVNKILKTHRCRMKEDFGIFKDEVRKILTTERQTEDKSSMSEDEDNVSSD